MLILITAVGVLILLIATSVLAGRIGVVTPLLLVVIGVGIGYIPGVPSTVLNPEIILLGVLPPLLYGAAVNVPVIDLRRNITPVFGLSFALVLVTALLIGWGLHALMPEIPLPAAIALGAVVAPPDAVAATSIGKRVGMPTRLVTILEGESLLNDATSLVLLKTAIAATAGSFAVWDAAGSFVYVVTVAVIFGLLIGAVTVWVRSHVNNPVHHTLLSFIVPFLAFIPTEELHASGVLAVVIAGLYTGHVAPRAFPAASRITEKMNWRTLQFVLENGVFLLMGLEMHGLVDEVSQDSFPLPHVALIAVAVFVSLLIIRMGAMFPVVWQVRRSTEKFEERHERFRSRSHHPRVASLMREGEGDVRTVRKREWFRRVTARASADVEYARRQGLDWRGSVLLGWSGMRGVVTLAAAQTIPADVPYRAHLILIAFGAAMLSLLVHGLTLPGMVKLLRTEEPDVAAEVEELRTLHDELRDAAYVAIDTAKPLTRGEAFSEELVTQAKHASASAFAPLAIPAALSGDDALNAESRGEAEQLLRLVAAGLEASRETLLDLRTIGLYSSAALQRAEQTIDVYELRFTPPKEH